MDQICQRSDIKRHIKCAFIRKKFNDFGLHEPPTAVGQESPWEALP